MIQNGEGRRWAMVLFAICSATGASVAGCWDLVAQNEEVPICQQGAACYMLCANHPGDWEEGTMCELPISTGSTNVVCVNVTATVDQFGRCHCTHNVGGYVTIQVGIPMCLKTCADSTPGPGGEE